VSFLYVDNSISMKFAVFSKHCEMMVTGEVSTLYVELIKHMAWTCMLSPNFLNVSILKFMVPVMMVFADLSAKESPVRMDIGVYFNKYVAHSERLYLSTYLCTRNIIRQNIILNCKQLRRIFK
jgi:hypothetical protein